MAEPSPPPTQQTMGSPGTAAAVPPAAVEPPNTSLYKYDLRPDSIVIALANVEGLESAIKLDVLERLGAQFYACSETRLRHNSKMTEVLGPHLRWGFYGVSRRRQQSRKGIEADADDDGAGDDNDERTREDEATASSGGVALIRSHERARRHDFTVTDVYRDSKGALAVVIEKKGYTPVVLIGAYVMTETSVYNSTKSGRGALFSSISAFIAHIKSTMDADIVMVGDMNSRGGWSDSGQRRFADNRTTASKSATEDFRSFLERNDLKLPIGETPDRAVKSTSFAVNNPQPPLSRPGFRSESDPSPADGAEADHIVVSRSLDSSRISEIKWVDPGAHIAHFSSHAIITFRLTLRKLQKKAKTTGPANDQREAEPTSPRPPRPLKLPPYSDARYFTFPSTYQRIMDASGQALRDLIRGNTNSGKADVYEGTETVIDTMVGDLELAARKHFAAATALPKEAVKRGGPRHPTFRRAHGCALPPQVQALLASARKRIRAAHKMEGSVSADSRAALMREASDYLAKAQKRAKQATRSLVNNWREDVERDRTLDPRGFKQALDRVIRGGKMGSQLHVLPDANSEKSPLQTFVEYLTDLVGDDPRTLDKVMVKDVDGNVRLTPEAEALVADGANSPEWMEWLQRPVTPPEVGRVLHASTPLPKENNDGTPTARTRVHDIMGHDNSCNMCNHQQEQADAHSNTDPDSPPLSHAPRIRNKAPGPSGVPAAWMTFSRCKDPAQNASFHAATNAGWAYIFNTILQSGRIPPSFAKQRSIVLPKGKPLTAAQPDKSRIISLSDSAVKTFTMVLLARLQHYLSATDLTTDEQVGFKPGHGTEFHHFALFEAIKEGWRQGKDVYLLFADFKKAFDSTSRPCQWAVLRRMGFPDDYVRALKHLNDMRTTRLTINGATSAEIPYRKGSPQGDPISPDVFNLMVQTLSNKLRASTILRGVKFSSPTTATSNAEAIVRFLWYADDLVVIGTSRAEIEEAARIIKGWADDWGFALATGPDKTNAMWLPAKRATRPLNAAPPDDPSDIVVDDLHITWAATYKYLGIVIKQTLDLSSSSEYALRNISRLKLSLVAPHSLTRQLSPKAILQLVKTAVMSPFVFGASFLPHTPANLAQIDDAMLSVVKRALRLPASSPSVLVRAEGGMPHAEALALMHRERLLETLTRTNFPGIAQNVLYAMESHLERAGTRPRSEWEENRNFLKPWVVTTQEGRDSAARRGIPTLASIRARGVANPLQARLATLVRAASYVLQAAALAPSNELSVERVVFTASARNVPGATASTAANLARDARLAARATTGPRAHRNATLPFRDPAARPPAPYSPIQFLAALCFDSRLAPLEAVPNTRILMDLTYYGAAGTSLVALSTVPGTNARCVSLAKLGAQGLHFAPFVQKTRRPGPPDPTTATDGSSQPAPTGAANSPAGKAPRKKRPAGAGAPTAGWGPPRSYPCRYCFGNSGPDGSRHVSRDPAGQATADVFHLLSGCTTGQRAVCLIRDDHPLAKARLLIANDIVTFLCTISRIITSIAGPYLNKDGKEELHSLARELRWWSRSTIPTRVQAAEPGFISYWDDTRDGSFLAFRLVVACQFGTRHLRDRDGLEMADMPISLAFARLLEYTPLTRADCTPIANAWIRFSIKQLKRLGRTWIEGLEPILLDEATTMWDPDDAWASTRNRTSPKGSKPDGPPPAFITRHFSQSSPLGRAAVLAFHNAHGTTPIEAAESLWSSDED